MEFLKKIPAPVVTFVVVLAALAVHQKFVAPKLAPVAKPVATK